MKCGISTACFYPQILEETIVELGENQIKNIEIFINTFSEMKKRYIKEIKKMIDGYGQTVVAVHPFTCVFEPFMLFTNYESRFQDGLEWHRHYFEVMNILGAEIFVFHGDRKEGFLADKIYFERFGKLRDLGKEFGVIVAQENVERCKSGSLDFLTDMVSYLGGDVSIVFDNKQAIRSNIAVQDFLDKLGKYIVHVHLSDHNEQCDCLPIGKGTMDVIGFLSELDKVGFNNNIIIELYRDSIPNNKEFFEKYHNFQSLFCTNFG